MKKEIVSLFGGGVRKVIQQCEAKEEELFEIHLRLEGPLELKTKRGLVFLNGQGRLVKEERQGYVVTKEDLETTIEQMGEYSLYSYEEELKNGYLTVRGGHRIGVSGKAIVEQGVVKNFRVISYLNLRLAREQRDCGRWLLPLVTHTGGVYNTLILSPPGAGKTTLLRDLIRLWSDELDLRVGVVDEREEIAANYRGETEFHIGVHTVVMEGCPKGLGLELLIRTMGIEAAALDEIGREEREALEYGSKCGIPLLATLHGGCIEDAWEKIGTGLFQRYVLLELDKRSGQRIESVYDEQGIRIYTEVCAC